jgi:hypothetical protein
MAMEIKVRQATDVPCMLIDLKTEETMHGYHSGHTWLLYGEQQRPITEEYLIDIIQHLISDGVFDATQEELLFGMKFCLGAMSSETIPVVEEE